MEQKSLPPIDQALLSVRIAYDQANDRYWMLLEHPGYTGALSGERAKTLEGAVRWARVYCRNHSIASYTLPNGVVVPFKKRERRFP